MNAMAMYYGPEVLYKNNLISNIMNFNENIRNFREMTVKKNGLTSKMTYMLAFESNKVLTMASNGVYGNIITS